MAEKTEARESEGWALSRRAFLQGALSLAGGAVVRPSLAAATPRLERLELVTDQAATGSGGNNWGGIRRGSSAPRAGSLPPTRFQVRVIWRGGGDCRSVLGTTGASSYRANLRVGNL